MLSTPAVLVLVLNPKNKFCSPGWALSGRHWAVDKAELWELPATSFSSPLSCTLSLSEQWQCLRADVSWVLPGDLAWPYAYGESLTLATPLLTEQRGHAIDSHDSNIVGPERL